MAEILDGLRDLIVSLQGLLGVVVGAVLVRIGTRRDRIRELQVERYVRLMAHVERTSDSLVHFLKTASNKQAVGYEKFLLEPDKRIEDFFQAADDLRADFAEIALFSSEATKEKATSVVTAWTSAVQEIKTWVDSKGARPVEGVPALVSEISAAREELEVAVRRDLGIDPRFSMGLDKLAFRRKRTHT